MSKRELLDTVYIVHVIAALYFLISGGDVVAWINEANTVNNSAKGRGHFGIAFLISILVIFWAFASFMRNNVIQVLTVLFIVSVVFGVQVLVVIYLLASIYFCFVYFVDKRDPPLFR